jgi:phosphatidylserine decarboxylase
MMMMESIKYFIPGIHKEGHVLILAFALATILLFLLSDVLGWLGVVLTLWCVFFFRDPERVVPITPNVIVSPADGLLQRITHAFPPAELNMPQEEMLRLSIFLNVFNVHVNRIPIDGQVEGLHYHPGKFFNASLDKASEHNERQAIWIKANNGMNIAVTQIAGLIARRIVCDLKADQTLQVGDRFGIIRFGSRVDLYIPKGTTLRVMEGQTMIGGETIIADVEGSSLILPAQQGKNFHETEPSQPE